MKHKEVKIPIKIKRPILAFGSQTKNTVCFAKDNFTLISARHLELSRLEDYLAFEKGLNYFLKKNPRIIAHDLHPEYQSTKLALQLNTKRYTLCAIQHHHAHIASCMAENGLRNQRVIGVAFDGTGLGTDNKLWGAEFLICDYKNFERIAHLKEIPLLGAEKAITEPYRLTLIWLYLIYKEKLFNLKIEFVEKLEKGNWPIFERMLLTGFNVPISSSMGRLFDAVASLILTKYKADFEAELAIALEKLAAIWRLPENSYNFDITSLKYTYIIDPLPMFKQIIEDLVNNEPREKIAYRFHVTVAKMLYKTCKILRSTFGLNKAVLSGGVFQNKLLLNLSLELLYKEGFQVFFHKDLSCNDSCISLGEAIIANFQSLSK